MNDEIKEILDKLKDGNWYDELDLTGEMWIELRWEETHLLLDYITKLQSNWNSLRKYIKTEAKIELYKDKTGLRAFADGQDILDKMNKLEGVDNGTN